MPGTRRVSAYTHNNSGISEPQASYVYTVFEQSLTPDNTVTFDTLDRLYKRRQ